MSLPFATRMRKLERLLAGFVAEGADYTEFHRLSLHHILRAVAADDEIGDSHAREAAELSRVVVHGDVDQVLRRANALRHRLRLDLGLETGDWDLVRTQTGPSAHEHGPNAATPAVCAGADRLVLPHRLFLEDVRSPYNVGAIFRAAESFGVAEILLSPGCASPEHPRASRSSMGTIDIVPWRIAELHDAVADGDLFLVETGGTELSEFQFPQAGTMMVGSEELGASPDARKAAARSAGTVTIGSGGVKGSLNVSVATGIVLYLWFAIGRR